MPPRQPCSSKSRTFAPVRAAETAAALKKEAEAITAAVPAGSKVIARCIEGKQLSSEELAEKIGVTPAAVGNWERCIARPDFDTVPKLCSVLRISVTELLDMEPEMGLNGEERDVLTSYRSMNPANRRMVRTLMSELEQNETEQRYAYLRNSAYRMPAVLAASAGFGATMDDELPTEQLYVRSNP